MLPIPLRAKSSGARAMTAKTIWMTAMILAPLATGWQKQQVFNRMHMMMSKQYHDTQKISIPSLALRNTFQLSERCIDVQKQLCRS